ncbi:MAG: hypothetical protein A2252_08835 [Elusimicrobia bacterium RIFOXYA2_FULL_39_19]|nr:MAG: hypothetical protein A2252_08835 [Elusimicrobia bacterium RIFOXYA2_FULL_39_19]
MPLKSFKIYRYQAILIILVVLITGTVRIISTETDRKNAPVQKYAYSIALTFDDGPYPEYTQKLLNILENENVKATFFVIGRHSKKNPLLMQLIASRGHEFGGHTYNHQNINKISKQKLLAEMQDTQNIIEQTTGKKTSLFRPPGGKYNKKSLNFISEAGYTTVLWSILPKDCEISTTKEDLIATVLKNPKNNDIILLHIGTRVTLEALPEIICSLRLKGFKFVTISELMDGISAQAKENRYVYLKKT